jgi:hypothetical protein
VILHNLFGPPAVGCSDPSRFYIAMPGTIALKVPRWGAFYATVSVAISQDGGQTFSKIVPAVKLDGPRVIVDAQIHVAPGPRGDILHVAYRVDDWSAIRPRSGNQLQEVIGYVNSQDGGETWGQPVTVATSGLSADGLAQTGYFADDNGNVVDSFPPWGPPRVASNGNDVYVAWEEIIPFSPCPSCFFHVKADFAPRHIKIHHSRDGGASFGPPATIDVTPAGDGSGLQGDIRAAVLGLQGLAVDPTSGAVYVTWQDGRNLQVTEPFSTWAWRWPDAGRYAFADVLLSRSVDGGNTWSAPMRVNDDPAGSPVDHFWPALAVDKTGKVVVAFADRRRDPRNFLIDVFLAQSEDGGQGFSNERVTKYPFPPMTAVSDRWYRFNSPFNHWDFAGDRLAVAVDSTGASEGAIATWIDSSTGHLDVASAKVPFRKQDFADESN